MINRMFKRFIRGLVATLLPVVVLYVAEQLQLISNELPPEYGAFIAPLLLALGKGLRDKGMKWTPF